MNHPDPAGRRLCDIEGYETSMVRYWLDPDGTLWSGPNIKSWWTTQSGLDVYDIYTQKGRRTISVKRLLRDAFGAPESEYKPTLDRARNPLRVAAITPEGDGIIFDSAYQAGKALRYQAGDVARTARHNVQILQGERTFSYKGIRKLRGYRLFLLDSLNKSNKNAFYEIL